MEITAVELHEFTVELEDVGSDGGHQVYQPGEITDVPGFILSIHTDAGLTGHYRGFMYTRPMVTQIEMAAGEFLLGRDPLHREGIWQNLWTAFRHTDHLGLGPIDIALWDLAGKHSGAPISTLLGGYRETIPAYASTYWGDEEPDGLSTPAAYADFAAACRERGYPAFKIHPTGHPQRDMDICRAVDDAVGSEMELMLDPASAYRTYADALSVGRVLDELGFLWYEDPMGDGGESIAASRRMAAELDTLVLGCEHVRTGPFWRADHLAADAVDLLRADAHLDGGITSVMKTAHLAEAFGVDVELHIGGPAHLHCLSAIRNSNYYEHGLLHPEVAWTTGAAIEGMPGVTDGEIRVPDGPGLGVDVDWSFVESHLTDHTVVNEGGASGLS